MISLMGLHPTSTDQKAAMNGRVPQQSMLSIADIPILLRSSYPAFWTFADRRYRNFYIPEDRQPEEIIDIIVIGDTGSPSGGIDITATRIQERNGTVFMHRGNAVGEWDRRRHHGRVRQSETDFAPPAQYADYGCDSFLRAILSFRLLESNGFLVHASGLVKDGKGYLFVGKSGAGKSTVARLSSETCTVLSDDLTFASLSDAGGKIYGTPFFGDFGTAGVNIGAPLDAIYFLRQSSFNSTVLLSAAAAVRKLLPSVVYFGDGKTGLAAVLDTALAFCKRIPCYDLDFTKDISFWRQIDG